MKRYSFLHGMVVLALLLAAVAGLTSHAQGLEPPSPLAPQDAVGTAFTYQGQLKLNGEPVNDECIMIFTLTDDASLQVGEALTRTVAISDGLFTQALDFGTGAFSGDARWLGIQVKCSNDDSFIDLGRQALTAVPYAQYALAAARALAAPWGGLSDVPADLADGDDNTTYSAGNQLTLVHTTFNVVEGAGSGLDADLLDGRSGAFYLSWDNMTDVPTGFADGLDDVDDGDVDPANELNATMVLNGTSLELADGGGTLTASLGVFQQPYANVVVVAQSGGDFASIQAALDSITDASDSNRYLVLVMPGVYTETVTMKSYVDIEGSGELTTRITFTGDGSGSTGTVVGADDAELRFLTVENTGGNTYAIAIYNNDASPRLTHVTVNSSGDTHSEGVRNINGSAPTMTNVTAIAWGGVNNNSVINNSSSPTMTHVTASAFGGTNSHGVHNNDSSSPRMADVTARASGGSNCYGVANHNDSSPTMTDVTTSGSGDIAGYDIYNNSSSPVMIGVTASASGGTNSFGVYNYNSSPTIHNCTIRASGGTTGNYGIHNNASSGSYTVSVNNSQVAASTYTIRNNAYFTTLVGATLLDGGTVSFNGGTVTCAGVYDEAYTFYASTCP